jgi:hypothetical protein
MLQGASMPNRFENEKEVSAVIERILTIVETSHPVSTRRNRPILSLPSGNTSSSLSATPPPTSQAQDSTNQETGQLPYHEMSSPPAPQSPISTHAVVKAEHVTSPSGASIQPAAVLTTISAPAIPTPVETQTLPPPAPPSTTFNTTFVVSTAFVLVGMAVMWFIMRKR